MRLAPPDELARRGQSLAMLDAILFPDDWDMRWHSFDARWAPGERVLSMRDGEGDFWFLLLTKRGAVLHAFAHEHTMSPWSHKRSKERGGPKPFPGLFEGFPKELAYAKTAASFCEDKNEVTFVAWWTGDGPWKRGPVPDGSSDLFMLLDAKPKTYVKWAKRYAEERIALADVEHVYAHRALTKALVKRMSSDADFRDVAREAKSIGYP